MLRHPRKPQFKVTPKNDSLNSDQLSPLAWPFFLILGVLAVATAFGIYRYIEMPLDREQLYFVLALEPREPGSGAGRRGRRV